MNADAEKLALHFKYCALIAVMLIIAIATERWSTSKDFTTYLSNAATMTSLFLGVVAIFYSFVSNDSMSRSLGSITTITAEVRDVRNEIEEFVTLTQRATDVSANNTVLVRDASATLTTSLGSLHETINALSVQNETLKGLVSSLPTRIDQLETKFEDVAKAIGEKPQHSQSPVSSADLSNRAINRFLARATLNQNLLAHACVLAASEKKPLSITEFTEAIEWDAPNQLQGFLSCMHAMQLCSRKSIEGQEKTYTLSAVHPELQAISRTYYMSYVTETYANADDDREKWLAKLIKVEALFL